MKKINDNEFLPSFGKTGNGKSIKIIEPFIHLVYYKWQTQPDNSVSYNLCNKKGVGDIDSEYPRKRNELSELRREKLERINQLNNMWNQIQKRESGSPDK